MFSAVLLGVLCLLSVLTGFGTAADAPVLLQSSSARWLVFPTAKTQHLKQRQQALSTAATSAGHPSEFDAAEDFFSLHREELSLHPACQMKLIAERRSPSSSLVHQSYQQRVGGVRVFGGDFKVTLSAAATNEQDAKAPLAVLNTHGTPLTEETLDSNFNEIDVARALQTDAVSRSRDIRRSIATYLTTSRVNGGVSSATVDLQDIELSIKHIPELVWYQQQLSESSSMVSLAFYVKGRAAIASGNLVSFYAFVDVNSENVLKLVQLNDDEHLSGLATLSASGAAPDSQGTISASARLSVLAASVPTSPFASPIANASIYCYDQYAKDYNDDQDDNYYDQDPDRFSPATLVFDTTSGTHDYPTTDAEMNLLIDNTLYAKYLYYSLSGGQYLTWQKVDGPLNIEYNLSLANAYFDGEWGIHFGTGFITDDVVAHEWSHGYTQTGDDLVYERQSGSMNEGFSDVFGESIDILNADSADTSVFRALSPASCTSTMNGRYGHGTRGTDGGNRWSIGEEVSYYHWSNGDGSFRDMYKPECFFHPGSVTSPHYACTTYYDNGGVHLNSGVFNHLFAVLVDGGEYVSEGGDVVSIVALGMVKTINLFWRAHEELSATSDFFDYAITINEVCTLNIGETLYYPNVFNDTIYEETSSLTSTDCDVVSAAVAASGMGSTEEACPNIDCSGARCEWAQCPAAATGNFEVFYEDYDYSMGDARVRQTDGKIEPVCSNISSSSYVRVFDQSYFHLDQFTLSCIQFGFIMLGKTTVTIDVFIDVNGGEPNYDSLQLLVSKNVTTINANNHMQVQTVSFDSPISLPSAFNSSAQTLVVMLTTPLMADGYIAGGGQVNTDVEVYGEPTGQTWLGGGCLTQLQEGESSVQWYVRLQGTSTYSVGSTEEDGFDDAEITAMIVAGSLVAVVFIAFSYYVITKNSDKLSKHVQLDACEDSRL